MTGKSLQQLQKEAIERRKAFQKELKELHRNREKYGVIEEAPGGYFFRLENSQYNSKSKKSKFGI
jgi:mRNA-degrading endonuclease RelE of RelBE toxin-antitoxin system